MVGNSTLMMGMLRPEGGRMKKETKEMFKELGYYSSLGISVAAGHFHRTFHRAFFRRLAGHQAIVYVYLPGIRNCGRIPEPVSCDAKKQKAVGAVCRFRNDC